MSTQDPKKTSPPKGTEEKTKSPLDTLFDRLEKTKPSSEESKTIADQIIDAIG
jgi:hypothetical protein